MTRPFALIHTRRSKTEKQPRERAGQDCTGGYLIVMLLLTRLRAHWTSRTGARRRIASKGYAWAGSLPCWLRSLLRVMRGLGPCRAGSSRFSASFNRCPLFLVNSHSFLLAPLLGASAALSATHPLPTSFLQCMSVIHVLDLKTWWYVAFHANFHVSVQGTDDDCAGTPSTPPHGSDSYSSTPGPR